MVDEPVTESYTAKECRQEDENVCVPVAHQECHTENTFETFTSRECKSEDQNVCVQVPEEMCTTVDETIVENYTVRECNQQEEEVCVQVPEPECSMIKVPSQQCTDSLVRKCDVVDQQVCLGQHCHQVPGKF